MKVEYNLESIIYRFKQEISALSQQQAWSRCPYEKSYYQRLIDQRTESFIGFITRADSMRQREFTVEELAAFDGANGRPAYAAVNGIVYDVSREATWGGGTHFGLYAGKDLTAQFMGCHQGMLQILSKLPQIGSLKR
jgi:predicted heme/steroid binding protein